MQHLLIVEDETRVVEFLSRGLREEGYAVTHARSGTEAVALMRGNPQFELIILDRMLPGLRGEDVCQQLRAAGDKTPVLMLTGRDAVQDKIEGLRAGADDYLTKPFSFDELVARIQALLRRAGLSSPPMSQIRLGDLTFDRDSWTVWRAGRPVALTAKELALLELLMSAPGKVFSRARILNNIWGYTADPLTNVVEVYIRRLRQKLDHPGQPLITTVRGRGYRLNPPDDGAGSLPASPDGGSL